MIELIKLIKMKRIKLFEEFISNDILDERSSGEIFKPKRNKSVGFDHKKYPELAGEFFDLISTAYSELGGHLKVKSPDDVFADPDWDYWEGVDIHGSSDFDLIMFGKKTKFGIKYAGLGHDGSKDAKRTYLDSRGKELNTNGFYIEASGKIAEILMNKYSVPVVSDVKDIEKVLGKDVNFIGEIDGLSGDGWYSRKIGGGMHNKIMLGKPKV